VLFIALNSVAGPWGLWLAKPELVKSQISPELALMLIAVVVSGGIGSRLGSRHWPILWIRRVLAVVLTVAGLRLLGIG